MPLLRGNMLSAAWFYHSLDLMSTKLHQTRILCPNRPSEALVVK